MHRTTSTCLRLLAGAAIAVLLQRPMPAAEPSAEATGVTASITVHGDQPGPVIHPEVYGQFAEHLGHCIYGGIWVGPDSTIPNTRGIRNDVVAALREIKVPLLRWPGGCFADEYHWKDGIGPRAKRPTVYNSHWGGIVENNAFGTHEFLDLCEQIGAEPYIGINVGSGTVQEMMQWIEYITSDGDTPMANLRRENGRDKPWKVKYFGIGNESWGCGGSMRPEYYADLYRHFQTFAKNYGDNRIFKIACGANASDYNWTEVLTAQAIRNMNGLSLHYYTLPTGSWKSKGSSTEFGEDMWFATLRNTLRMDDLVSKHSAIMDKLDPDQRVALVVDEWGTWYDVEPGTNPGFLYQQNTLRDALVAALNFHIFQKHASRVRMADIAQMVNVLQSMILTDGDKMLRTPTYWAFEMFKVNQGATYLPVDLSTPDYKIGDESIPAISASATRSADGKAVHLSLVNVMPATPATITCSLAGVAGKTLSGRVLTAPQMNAHNTFAAPDAVIPVPFTAASLNGDQVTLTLPPKSVVILELK